MQVPLNSKTPGAQIKPTYKLIQYQKKVFKFRIEFDSCNKDIPILENVIENEIDAVMRAIIQSVNRQEDICNKIESDWFRFLCSEAPWAIATNLFFLDQGEKLENHETMFIIKISNKVDRDHTVNCERREHGDDGQNRILAEVAETVLGQSKRQTYVTPEDDFSSYGTDNTTDISRYCRDDNCGQQQKRRRIFCELDANPVHNDVVNVSSEMEGCCPGAVCHAKQHRDSNSDKQSTFSCSKLETTVGFLDKHTAFLEASLSGLGERRQAGTACNLGQFHHLDMELCEDNETVANISGSDDGDDSNTTSCANDEDSVESSSGVKVHTCISSSEISHVRDKTSTNRIFRNPAGNDSDVDEFDIVFVKDVECQTVAKKTIQGISNVEQSVISVPSVEFNKSSGSTCKLINQKSELQHVGENRKNEVDANGVENNKEDGGTVAGPVRRCSLVENLLNWFR